MKALLEKVQPELIGLDPGQLGKVDQGSFEQRHKERVDILVSSAFLCSGHKSMNVILHEDIAVYFGDK